MTDLGEGSMPDPRGIPAGLRHAPRWFHVALVAGLYVVTAKIGLALEGAYGSITPFWPPTGIALAALVLFGRGVWPGVALGAFIANVTTPAGPVAAMGITAGNTLEALIGFAIVRRFGFDARLERMRDIAILGFGAAAISTTASATLGVASLVVTGNLEAARFGYSWALWWFGDAMGAMIVAPLLLVWITKPTLPLPGRHLEAFGLTVGLLGAGGLTFFSESWSFPAVLFPFLIWSALRFRQRGATAAVFAFSAMGVAAVNAGQFPPGDISPTESVAVLQTLLSIASTSMLVLAAAISERLAHEALLGKTHKQMVVAQQVGEIGSWEWDIPANKITWSEELYRIYGIERPDEFEATYEAFVQALHPDDRERVDGIVKAAFGTGSSFAFDHRIVRPDGSIRTLHGRGEVITNSEGVPIAMVGTGQDVTERRTREEALRVSEERFRTIVETAEEGIATVDTSGMVTFSNAKLSMMLGHDLTDRSLFDRADGLDREALRKLVHQASLGTPQRREIRFAGSDGRDVWTIVSAGRLSPLAEAGAVLMVSDISERKRLESLRDRFIGNAAHELRTPITSMVGFAGLLAELRERLTDEQVHHMIERMNFHGDRLRRMLDALLDITRVQQADMPQRQGRVSLSEALSVAIAGVERRDGTIIRTHLQPGIEVLGDMDAVVQVFQNLIENAILYGGSHVAISASESGGQVTVEVHDDGAGVPEETIPGLFDAFERGPNSAGTAGAGLGLALVHMLVESLRGSVAYESGDFRGARFVVRLRAVERSPRAATLQDAG